MASCFQSVDTAGLGVSVEVLVSNQILLLAQNLVHRIQISLESERNNPKNIGQRIFLKHLAYSARVHGKDYMP